MATENDSIETKKEAKQKKKKSRLREKLYHVFTVVVLVTLSHLALHAQWLLPIFYAISLPIVISIRIFIYFKNKWHYFLLDFCYYANLAWFIFIWIADSPRMFAVVFGIANGPLLWAMVVYRNSLVFHNHDKVSSSFIHIVPGTLSFAIRWYPKTTSTHWVKDFNVGNTDWDPEMLIWLFLIPLCCFLFHSGMYALVIHVIKKPGPEHFLSYNYLGTKKGGCIHSLFNCCGEGSRKFFFYFFNWLFCFCSLTGVVLSFYFFAAHCVLLVTLTLIIVYNGASYYMHVFSVRGFVDEIE
ncbi:uncharacterized membrane protein C776.05-like isoform X2 [Mizuhopecten yessoensis]|uniref:uncharacterized membrane protein C776.05-like isoform X2 n=1 Tax=Mizuhopecten yessoensis TaxID=6573 RepID=UPI000B45F692|nr:uncharacterized membrane protein C776.05-like isoform X2 [Mizuhopecten yessoensis]